MSKIKDILKRNSRIKISMPFLSYEVNLDEIIDSKSVDDRIAKLGEIKNDLQAAVAAVDNLRSEAETKKHEADALNETVTKLREEKSTAEELLKLPEEAFTNLLTKANSKGRWRGIIEGTIVGFLTGVLSSLLVWLITK